VQLHIYLSIYNTTTAAAATTTENKLQDNYNNLLSEQISAVT